MNELEEQLAASRTLADGSAMDDIDTNEAASELVLVKLNTKRYSLPWAHYAGAEYFPVAPGDEGAALERIELSFLQRHVTLHGRNLAKLIDGIKGITGIMRMARVPETPERYLNTEHVRDMGGPIVTRIDVEPRG